MTDSVVRRIRERSNADPDSVERWRLLLDESKIDDQAFLSEFLISTEEVADDGVIRPVKFNYRPVQKVLSDLQDQMEFVEGIFTEIRIPKSRKHGISRQTTSRYGFARIMRRAGYITNIIAQDDDSSKEHFERLTELYDQVDWVALRELGYRKVETTKRSIVILHPNGFKSIVRVRTASKRGLGRGGTPNAILLTERGSAWSAEAERALSGLLMSQRRVRGNALIDESTAGPEGNGFHVDCVRARDKRGGARLFFIPSFKHPLNYKELDKPGDGVSFVEDLGNAYYGDLDEEKHALDKVARYWKGEGLEEELARFKALEFLHWRRFEIDGPCKGSVETFHRDQPTTFDEAFHGTGLPVFDVRVLRTWGDRADEKQRAGVRGRLFEKDNAVVFEPMPTGPLIVYHAPAKDDTYGWGNDVASGKRKQTGSGHEADWTVITVGNVYTGNTVAKFRAHVKTPECAKQLILLARWFQCDLEEAKGFVELGGGYGDAVISNVLQFEEGAYEGILLTTSPEAHAGTKAQQETRYGFQASTQGKALLKSRGEEFIQEMGAYEARNLGAECPFDRDTLDELMHYSYNERGGMEASTGHDDCVAAVLLMLEARAWLFAGGEVKIGTRASPQKPESDVKRALREQDARIAQEEKDAKDDGVLAGY